MKISSIDILKYFDILNANKIDGLYLPFSNELIVCLDTSNSKAKSSCVIFFSFRISSNLFFKNISTPFLLQAK